MSDDFLLKVKNLKTVFYNNNNIIYAVNNVSFNVKSRETLAIVGESGCGKSVTALSLLGLIDSPGKIVDGEVLFNGKNLLDISKKELREIRGKDISMVFQNPMTSLNPILTVGTQIKETIRSHKKASKEDCQNKTLDILTRVGLPAKRVYKMFPFQLSGGMCQRVMIAMALCLGPKIIIADEPTTALDVTVQAQILSLLRQLKEEFDTGIILITHDLGVVAQMADEVAVMYAGSIVEYGNVFEIFRNPAHPYTKALLNSVRKVESQEKLRTINGQPPILTSFPKECSFMSRCPYSTKKCQTKKPSLEFIAKNHQVACFQTDKER
ncbi:MAG: ABC transporter ATP-binding protein [Tepidanaerobacter acetatoxydans]|uniref:ABC transporter ATP-binding protein n=1 Tax=Tepidanaerobacter acetatoxydans TaxID=499229 RepID=UPI001BD36475|nr:ABC transporter ATP-binding protein [Tepidanaerobacter acetatoxydans]NLU11253.1 ABC transporter ATP-binding protein [Tepidanaerobacter acetatoxydans]